MDKPCKISLDGITKLVVFYSVSEATDDVLQSVGTAKKVTIATGLHVPDRIGAKKLEESTVQDEKNVDVNVGNMQTDDILKYIQCNTEKDDKDLDLF